MFTKECITNICPIYDYQIEYLKQSLLQENLKPSSRAFISKNNSMYSAHSLPGVSYVSAYIGSQQHPMLKNFVPRRHHIMSQQDAPNLEIFFNTTYFDRIAHFLMVPITGSVTYQYTEGPKIIGTLTPGSAYILNNRSPRHIVDISSDYLCYISLWLDFDLMFFLKEYDGNSKIERKADEYFPKSE